MNPSAQLRDIRGLDDISWWPLAQGWWLLIVLMILSGILIGFLTYRYLSWQKKRRYDWRPVARQEWLALQTHSGSTHEKMVSLSHLLRRIAIQRYGRTACAGLTGESWLVWLTQHDPKGFNWEQAGRVLIDIPYQPPEVTLDNNQITPLYQAVGAWIEEPCQIGK